MSYYDLRSIKSMRVLVVRILPCIMSNICLIMSNAHGECPSFHQNRVSRKTGLSPHVIRIWEKRYEAVEPERTTTNRRLYSDAEIERLSFLRLATEAGHSIGNIAKLPLDRFKLLVAKAKSTRADHARTRRAASPAQTLHDSCLTAVKRLDARAFEETMQRAIVALGNRACCARWSLPWLKPSANSGGRAP